jgi:hypothetical protein
MFEDIMNREATIDKWTISKLEMLLRRLYIFSLSIVGQKRNTKLFNKW